MRLLEKEFAGRGQVKGFKFTQIKKNEFMYLYEVTDGINTHYEVFERKINRRYNCESKPSNKSFGIWAWTIKDKSKSFDTFDEKSMICAERKRKINELKNN